MNKIIWTDIQYNAIFEPVLNIREKAVDFETCMDEDFPNKFNILPNIPNAPYSVPRMMANNIDGLSLNISADSITLTKSISNNHTIKIEEFVKKAKILNDTLRKIQDKELFIGFILRGNLNLDKNPVEYIKKKILNINSKQEIFDLQTKFTFRVHDKYYVNITLGNMRKDENDSLLAIEIDMNDRYRYNFKKVDYPYSDKEAMTKIERILNDIINKKINSFVEKGEFDNGDFE